MPIRTALCAGMIGLAIPSMGQAEAARDNSLSQGERMIARCVDYARGEKLTPLSIGVIDLSGTLVAFKRQEGASPATADAALLKARTALRLDAPTAVLGQVAAEDAATRDTFLIMQMTTLPGGIPFRDEAGRLAGAVGVSGGTAAQDVACAQKALEALPAKR
ncbi:MAG TPA: heme-binding protein [Nevskiaceae bacterium]|nr:heme-binding protein [Nevskiaceae bacterium]